MKIKISQPRKVGIAQEGTIITDVVPTHDDLAVWCKDIVDLFMQKYGIIIKLEIEE